MVGAFVTADDRDRLKAVAQRNDLSISQVIRRALRSYIDRSDEEWVAAQARREWLKEKGIRLKDPEDTLQGWIEEAEDDLVNGETVSLEAAFTEEA